MCRRALIMPRHFIITLSLVLAHLSALAFAMTCSIDAKDVPGTTGCLSAAAASMPDNAKPAQDLGEFLAETGHTDGAMHWLQECVKRDKRNSQCILKIGLLHLQAGRHQSAIPLLERAAKLQPSRLAFNSLGIAYAHTKQVDRALLSYAGAVCADDGIILNTVAVLVNAAGAMYSHNASLSLRAYTAAVRCKTSHAQARFGLGRALLWLSPPKVKAAAYHLGHSIRLDPSLTQAYVHYSRALRAWGGDGSAAAAVRVLQQLVRRPGPDGAASASAWNDLGDSLGDALKFSDAIQAYTKALQLRPDSVSAQYSRLHYLLHLCDWGGMANLQPHWNTTLQAELNSGAFTSLTPVEALYLLDAHSLKRVASNFAARASSFVDKGFVHAQLQPSLPPGGRVKLAYLGGGFRDHPDGKNMQAMFSMHSRLRSHVHIFSLKRDPSSNTQRYISQAVETWVDISHLQNDEAAAAINSYGIHVLFDVSGYTGEGVRDQRCVILAHSPSPVQVNFLAWVATSGASYIQHIVTDAVASPPETAPLYSEKLLLMPHSYFPSSIAWRHRRSNTEPPQPTSAEVKALRVSLKLPSPPIMSAFNQLWKIDSELWGCVCRVLLRVPNATLWLQEFPEAARNNLLKAAVSMGLNSSRFHWTPLYAEEQHFLVKSLSNVQLDTLSYNGHTSLADVLWAGVPSVTLPMEKQSARVGASLLRGLGRMHTVARSIQDYEDLVVALLQTQRASVRSIVGDLRAIRNECSLWNAGAWVEAFETLALRSYEVRSMGGSMHVLASATISKRANFV